MRVTCDFYGPLRDAVGQKSVECEISPGSTVRDVLERVADDYPALREQLLDDGELRDSMHVTSNTTHINLIDGMDTQVEDGDVLRAYPALEGG